MSLNKANGKDFEVIKKYRSLGQSPEKQWLFVDKELHSNYFLQDPKIFQVIVAFLEALFCQFKSTVHFCTSRTK